MADLREIVFQHSFGQVLVVLGSLFRKSKCGGVGEVEICFGFSHGFSERFDYKPRHLTRGKKTKIFFLEETHVFML